MWRFIALLGAGCCSCSFAFVSGPPSEPTDVPVRPNETCTTSVPHPVLDTVGAVVGGANIAIASNASPGEKVAIYSIEMEPETGVALGITQLALFGAGAIYGFVQTSRCNAYREKLEQRPEGTTWSPALAPDNRMPSNEASDASRPMPPARPAVPPSPPVAQPAPAAPRDPAPGTTSKPPTASQPPSVPTAAFPD